jgi:tetratricopeptide (TPR) repeat protein
MVNVGQDLSLLGRFDEVLAWYQRALAVDPGHANAYLSRGDFYALTLGRFDAAIAWYVRAISVDPGNPDFHAAIGLSFLNLGDTDRAEHWIQRSIELGPEANLSNIAVQILNFYRRDPSSLDSAREAIARSPGFGPALTVLRNHELEEGRPAEARALYERSNPELLNDDDPRIHNNNYRRAIYIALVLIRTGEQERADLLLDRSLDYIQTLPRLSAGYGIADVEIYALKGDKQKALSALRRAVDEKWRAGWRYFLKRAPSLEPLHDEPEFQAMVAEIEADMAVQLERVLQMERNGRLEPIPDQAAE